MFVFALLLVLPALILADPPANLEGDLFKALDEDGDGKISKDEAISYLLSFDSNKDNDITEQEFSAGIDKVDPAFAGHEAALFKLLDKNSNGKVLKSDLEAAFKLIDTDDDKSVSKAEFKATFDKVVSQIG